MKDSSNFYSDVSKAKPSNCYCQIFLLNDFLIKPFLIFLKPITGLNPIPDGREGAKRPPPPHPHTHLTVLFSVTSANAEIRPKNFLTFSFNTLVPITSPKLLTLSQDHPSEKRFPHKIEVIITSLTEMVELPNFDHMTAFTL